MRRLREVRVRLSVVPYRGLSGIDSLRLASVSHERFPHVDPAVTVVPPAAVASAPAREAIAR